MLLAAILVAPILPAVAVIAGLFLLLRKPVEASVRRDQEDHSAGSTRWWNGHGKEIDAGLARHLGPDRPRSTSLCGLIVAGGQGRLERPDVGIVRPGIALLETIFRAGWGFIAATTRATWDLISGIFKAAWDVISGVVQIAVAGVESVIKIAWDLIVGIFDVALDLLTGHWSKAWDDIQNTVTQVWNAIKGFLGSAISDIESMFTGAWNALLGGVKSWGSDLIGYFKQIPGMILAALGDVGHMLWNAGVVDHQGADRRDQVRDRRDRPRHGRRRVGRSSRSCRSPRPSKARCRGKGDPYYSGLSIGKKLAQGITASLPGLKSAVSGTVGQINSALSKAATEEKSGTSQISTLTYEHGPAPGAPQEGGDVDQEADRRPGEGIPDGR